MRRFFVSKLDEKAGVAVLSDGEFHHLRDVLRLAKGDQVIVFNGKGGEYGAVIKELRGGKVFLEIIKRLNTFKEPKLRITLAQALPKGGKMDFIVQKATELGVSEVYPLLTARSVPDIEGDRALRKVERWRRIAKEAAKQCGRAYIPEIHFVITFKDLLSLPFDGERIIFWEGEKERKLRDLEGILRRSKGLLLTVGPEGGFSEEEIEAASSRGFIPVGLGERILRAETAPIVALSILFYMSGDMG